MRDRQTEVCDQIFGGTHRPLHTYISRWGLGEVCVSVVHAEDDECWNLKVLVSTYDVITWNLEGWINICLLYASHLLGQGLYYDDLCV